MYLQSQISLLGVSQLLHLTPEAAFLNWEATQLTNHRTWLRPHIITEDSSKQIKWQTPATQQHVMGDYLSNSSLMSGKCNNILGHIFLIIHNQKYYTQNVLQHPTIFAYTMYYQQPFNNQKYNIRNILQQSNNKKYYIQNILANQQP